MQTLLKRSKILLLAVLSSSLILAWSISHMKIPGQVATTVNDNVDTQPAGDVWNSLSSEFKLDHKTQSTRVQAEIRSLLADQGKLRSILTSASPYIYYIYQQTQKRGLPAELALIPVIESEFNPNDHSNKGALGLWQLMPETATELGVKVHGGYDGRRNVIASTTAALAYFRDLGKMFNGNWYLAIAAYNCGQFKVEHAMKRSGSDSYWNLPLPRDTKVYVPRLLAVAEIVKNPEKYGIQLPQVNNKPYFTQVTVNKSVNLNNVAKSSEINIKTLHALNPDYKQDVVPNKGAMLVPADKAAVIKSKMAGSIVNA